MVLTNAQYRELRKNASKNHRFLTYGGQYSAFLSDADIVIMVGNRGSSKTHTMLTKVLSYIHVPTFNAYLFRKEIKDLNRGIVKASKKLFTPFGKLRESQSLLDWIFNTGATCTFLNYSAPIDEFTDKVQGAEVDFIGIDEFMQMLQEYFNILMANLRNSNDSIRPQIYGAGNPDGDSWVKDFISPYIDFDSKYHTHKPEMNGKKLYFFQDGDNASNIIYGETKEEVYKYAKDGIDELVENSKIENANPLDFILSMAVFYMPRSENPYIMGSKGGGASYEARMSKMSLQQRIYAVFGGWKKVDSSANCLVREDRLQMWLSNNPVVSGTKYASMDMSGSGKDKTILNIWDGYHLEDVLYTDISDAKSLVEWTKRQLVGNGVRISRQTFVYDSDGLGWAFSGHFGDDEAFAFKAKAPPSEDSMVESFDGKMTKIYQNAKSEVVGKFLKALNDYNGTGECGLSIDEDVLGSKIRGKTLKQWITEEVKGLEWKPDTDGIKQLIPTKEMDAKIGHHSDILISIIYRFALDVGETNVLEPITNMDNNYINDLYAFFL